MCQLLLHNVWKLLLVYSLLSGASAVFSMPQCNLWGNIDIVQNQQPEITCTGLKIYQNIYWSITDPISQHETRIANCSNCNSGCPPCTVITGIYNVSRELHISTTLKFLNTSLITSGSTLKCSNLINSSQSACTLFTVPAAANYSLTQCNRWGNFDIVQNQQPVIICTGLRVLQNIYWSITDPTGQHETRIANCSHCKQGCPPCTVITDGYNVSRELHNSTTLKFMNSSLITSGSTLKCSQRNNWSQKARKLFVVPDAANAGRIRFPQCNAAGNIDIVRDQETVVTCTGLKQSQGIYWSIRDPNGQVETILGECDNCYSECDRCRTIDVGYNVSRETEDSTTLKIMNSSLITSGWRVKCSERNNITEKSCTVFVVQAYRIPACSGDVITVSDMQGTPVACEGLQPIQSMYWTLTYGNGTVSTIATCTFCQATCPPCAISDSDFKVTREDNSSTLVIQTNVRQKDGATLTCSKRDDVTHADCKIRVLDLLSKTSGQNTESLFPVAAVVGGAVGGVLVVVVVVVIIVFIKRRESRDADEPITEEPVSSADDMTRTYDHLNMLDVGLPSVYAGVYSSPPDASGDVALYNGLNTPEVGQPSVYSHLGQNNTNTDVDYEVPL